MFSINSNSKFQENILLLVTMFGKRRNYFFIYDSFSRKLIWPNSQKKSILPDSFINTSNMPRIKNLNVSNKRIFKVKVKKRSYKTYTYMRSKWSIFHENNIFNVCDLNFSTIYCQNSFFEAHYTSMHYNYS